MSDFAAVTVPAWAPGVGVATNALTPAAAEAFTARLRRAYRAPGTVFHPPEPVLVTGGMFAVVSAARGLLHDSVHMVGQFAWTDIFAGIGHIDTAASADGPAPLLLGNAGHTAYYHWTVQSLAAALVHRALTGEREPLVVPALDGWRRDSLALLGVDNSLVEVPRDAGLALARAQATNLTGGDFAFAPHPAVLALFRAEGRRAAPGGKSGRRLYLSRRDVPGRRGTANEAALIGRLAARGFEPVELGARPLAEQIALVRQASLIVAPHGGALTNLVYAEDGEDGPRVVELMQANYLNRCFACIAQAKGLDYRAVVNPCLDPAAPPHLSSWTADLDLVEAALSD